MAAVSTALTRADAKALVAVRAPARLHLGFLDPAGTLGRRFGSIGLVIDGFATEVEMAPAGADTLSAVDPAGEAELGRAAAHLQRLRGQTGRTAPLTVNLRSTLAPHAGFGSGTQLALALGRAFARLHGMDVPTATLAAWLGRGLRSGVGIAGFDQGGLIVDGGPAADGRAAPVLARLAMPADWRIVVVEDRRLQGLMGADERAALAMLPPLPQAAAADICHQVLMRVLPGAAAADFGAFAAGVGRIQRVLGEHFAPAQRGSAWTSAAVGQLLGALQREAGAELGIGQSSWGPTGFAFMPSAAAAQRHLDALAERIDPALAVHVVSARNRGATEHSAR
jgi:beta-ribofuranosylaminobenzene 5'-phosphate synthase